MEGCVIQVEAVKSISKFDSLNSSNLIVWSLDLLYELWVLWCTWLSMNYDLLSDLWRWNVKSLIMVLRLMLNDKIHEFRRSLKSEKETTVLTSLLWIESSKPVFYKQIKTTSNITYTFKGHFEEDITFKRWSKMLIFWKWMDA